MLVAAYAASALPAPAAPAPAGARSDLARAARCVSDFLEAVIAAAPTAPRRARAGGEDIRWDRARSYLAPRALAALAGREQRHPLAPWDELGRDGAFLGYELSVVRRAPRGAAVVYGEERLAPSPRSDADVRRCAWLVVPIAGAWRVADARCAGRDFGDDEVRSGYAGWWDEPATSTPAPRADDDAAFGVDER